MTSEPEQRSEVCAICGKLARAKFGSIWLCQKCGDVAAENYNEPSMTTDDVRLMWEPTEQPGKEPNQETVQLSPLPPYEYPTTTSGPNRSSVPGTPLPVQLVRDPERVTEDTFSRKREKVPGTHSPTPTRTRPFLPARSPHEPTPVQDAPVRVNHPISVEQPPPSSSRTAPETLHPAGNAPSKNSPPKHSSQRNTPSQNSPKISPRGNFQGENSGGEFQPEGNFSPKSTKKFTKQLTQKRAGRQRGKDRGDEHDGVRQMFELWWREGESRGVNFGSFYRRHLSFDMCKYYRRYYIRGENPKSAADYTRWRAEWEASQTA